MIYLDSAATTLQKPDTVPRAVLRALQQLASPGRGGYAAAMSAAEEAFRCRESAARLFGMESPERIIFCQNATHALNLAIKAMARPGDTVLISGYEHNAVLRPLHALGAKLMVAEAPLFRPDAVLEAYEARLRDGARLAIVNQVSNVFGMIQPVAEIAALCRNRDVPLIVDASQAAGVLPVEPERWQAAFVAMPGHKGLYGPQGTGLLLCGSRLEPAALRTLIEGGSGSDSQLPEMPPYFPDRLEAGTHNMPGIAGLRAGLDFVQKLGISRIWQQEQQLLRQVVLLLSQNPRLRLFAAEQPERQTGVLSFQLQDMDCTEAAERLGQRGFSLRAGLHCAPLAHRSAGTEGQGTVRLSVSVFNHIRELQKLAKTLENL